LNLAIMAAAGNFSRQMETKQREIRNRKAVHGYLVNVGSLDLPRTGLADATITNSAVSKPVRRLSLWMTTTEGHELRYDHELDGSDKSRSELSRLCQLAEIYRYPNDSSKLHGAVLGLRFEAGWFCGFECPSPIAREVAK
jgi:hypothetical protein